MPRARERFVIDDRLNKTDVILPLEDYSAKLGHRARGTAKSVLKSIVDYARDLLMAGS